LIWFIGKLFRIDDLDSVEAWDFRFSAPWAEGRPGLVLIACVAIAVLGIVFYMNYQKGVQGRRRVLVMTFRSLVLAALVFILSEPVVSFKLQERPKPLLPVVIDGTESMTFKDKLPSGDMNKLAAVLKDETGRALVKVDDASRLELIRGVLSNPQHKVLNQLAQRYRLRVYVMDQRDELRELPLNGDSIQGKPSSPKASSVGTGATPSTNLASQGKSETVDANYVTSQLAATGRVTAIEAALKDLRRRHRRQLAGVVVISDFAQNIGDAVTAADEQRVPIYAVGVGPREVVNLEVAGIKSDRTMLKDNDTVVSVDIKHSGLTGRTVNVQLMSRRLGSFGGETQSEAIPVSPMRTVVLTETRMSVSLPFTPSAEGAFKFSVAITPFEDEVLADDNVAERDVTVYDESMKLLFVEYEPTWEWRFMKEVFHRHRLIGREGFRTFLRSADFKVRRENELFSETLVRPRNEFFANDVIFLSDVPAEMLSEHFQEMLHEYVSEFGGGLVVMAGPRFGPNELAKTKIADMLPVVLDPAARIRVGDFQMQARPEARDVPFMNLGGTGDANENRKAWRNMGRLSWYQPVLRADPRASVLAVHPTDRCVDGKLQPLIATRSYGRGGQVVYIAHNEMWRLRKRYGEKYYAQFWGQMMSQLGLGKNLGDGKRFQLTVDRKNKIYEVGEKARVIIEAYNEDFKALSEEQLEAKHVTEEGGAGGGSATIELNVSRREGNFYEVVVPVETRGKHRILVRDPITHEMVEVDFEAAPQSLEQRHPQRDYSLQRELASTTGGRAYELFELNELVNDLDVEPKMEYSERKIGLWNTWAFLIMVLILMMGEWLARKLMNMR
jgi:hypothetical protein